MKRRTPPPAIGTSPALAQAALAGPYGHPHVDLILKWFDANGYLSINPDVHPNQPVGSGVESAEYHFVYTGFGERRLYSPQLVRYFDAAYYRPQLGAPEREIGDYALMQHWVYEGIFNGLAASAATGMALDSVVHLLTMSQVGEGTLARSLAEAGLAGVVTTSGNHDFAASFPGCCMTYEQLVTLKALDSVRRPLVFVSGVADPIDWSLASIAKGVEKGDLAAPGSAELTQLLRHRVGHCLSWFRHGYHQGIDVYRQPFDAERGLGIIDRGRTRVILYRADRAAASAGAIRSTLGLRSLRIPDETSGAPTITPADFHVPQDLWEAVATAPYTRHFFTERELHAMEARWLGRSMQQPAPHAKAQPRPKARDGSASTSPLPAQREALLVLGMHRSGTSAIAGVMVHLGAQAPASLMPPTADNPHGYWESMKLYDFHDRLLHAAGTSWMDWRRFDAATWVESPAAAPFADELARLVAEEFGAAPIFLAKDPRACRLVPFWLRQLRRLEVTPKVILALRNPLDAARSLSAREGITLERSLLIWLRHMLDAELDTRTLERCVVHYEELLRDWRGVADRVISALHLALPPRSAAVESEIEGFLMPQLRHHASAEPLPGLPSPALEWVRRAYQALSSLAGKGRKNDDARQELDRLRLEFDRQSALFAPAILDQDDDAKALAADLQSLRERLARSTGAIAELGARLGDAERAQQLTSEELAASRAEAGRLAQRVEALAGQAAEIERARRDALSELERRGVENQQLAHSLGQARQAVAWLESRVGELQIEVTSLRRMLAQADAAREAAERLAAQQRDETAQRGEQLGALGAELSRVRAGHRRAGMLGPWRARRSFREQMRRIAESGLFQSEWYLAQNPALQASGIDPVEDYLESGAWQGRNPNPWFESAWYLARYPDVLAAGVNPLLHYLIDGAREGRDPGPRFSTAGYLARTPQAAASGLNPLAHYLREEGASRPAGEAPAGAP
jgi:hypothetical protein